MFDDTLVIIGNVSGTPAEHIRQLRSDGVCEASIRYSVAHAIDNHLNGVRPGPTTAPHESYVEWSRSACDYMRKES